jgi:predicted secreted protein
MSCATCHVVVASDWADRAGPPGAFEEDMLDITDLADSNIRRRIAGLRDLSFSLDCDIEAANVGYLNLRACYIAGTAAYIRFLPDGTSGIMVPVLVESKEINASVDGKVSGSFSLQSEGSIDPVTHGATLF